MAKRMVRKNRNKLRGRKLSPFTYWQSQSHKSNYRRYLKSLDWYLIRQKMLKICEYECELCESKKKLEVHHMTYDNLFEERLSDLMVLCEECHADQHS